MSARPSSVDDPGAGAQLITNLSHELLTPLSVVVGYAGLLERRGDEELRREASKRILEAADRLSHAIDDLIVVFALERGDLPVDLQPVDLEEVVRRAAAQFDATVAELEGGWPTVHADEQHLGRVLTDLLRRARARSVDCELQIAVEAKGDSAAITIADNGSGVTPDQLASGFEGRLAAAGPSHRVAGVTGLELYKVRRLVELQGGTISATSERGGGSQFTLSFEVAGDGRAR
jgi:signal transduction histidine kinase